MGYESFLGVNFWDALFTLANTLTIFFVAKKFLFGPVMKLIADRQSEIDRIYEDADAAKQSAEAMQDEYRRKLSEAQSTSDRLVKEATVRAQKREEEILRQANADAGAIRDKAAADIAREKKQAVNDAKGEISDIALAIAEKVVGRELNAADQQRLVDEFLKDLGENV
ncbi:MAG: F0F1 ATP synthase subunit B [Firmicutes bacterium]|nr:F0F1 ATP synthase subunit B [Bacillota bacterium]